MNLIFYWTHDPWKTGIIILKCISGASVVRMCAGLCQILAVLNRWLTGLEGSRRNYKEVGGGEGEDTPVSDNCSMRTRVSKTEDYNNPLNTVLVRKRAVTTLVKTSSPFTVPVRRRVHHWSQSQMNPVQTLIPRHRDSASVASLTSGGDRLII
jgi:hypothetical protein